MGVEVYLTEGLIACGVGVFLFHPRSRAVSGHNGNLVKAVGGGDHAGMVTNDVLFVQSLYEGMLELIRNEVTALTVGADLQVVAEFGGNTVTGTCLCPECFLIGIGGATGLFILLSSFGLLGQGLGGGEIEYSIHCFEALHAGDLVAEFGDVVLHAGVGGIILDGQGAVVLSARLQKSLCRFQSLGTFHAKFVDSHNKSS